MLNEWIKPIAFEVAKKENDLLMTWDMIRECSKSGIQIGSHSLTHQNLSQLEDENELYLEITKSKKRIEEEVGERTKIFAFPNGLYSKKSLNFVMNSGYEAILLCDDKASIYEEFFSTEKSNIYPRININGGDTKEEYLRSLGFHQRIAKLLKGQEYILNSDLIFNSNKL